MKMTVLNNLNPMRQLLTIITIDWSCPVELNEYKCSVIETLQENFFRVEKRSIIIVNKNERKPSTGKPEMEM